MKQINQFEEANAVGGSDLLLIQPAAGGLYKKVTKANLLQGYSVVDGVQTKLSEATAVFSASLSANGNIIVSVSFAKVFILTKCSVSFLGCRVRVYIDSTFAVLDLNRVIGGRLPSSHGLIYEAVFDDNLSLDVLPSATSSSANVNRFVIVNELFGGDKTVDLSFTYIPF